MKTLTVLLVRIPPSALSDSFPFSLFPFPVPDLLWQVPKNLQTNLPGFIYISLHA